MTPLVELVRLPALWGLDALGLALLIGYQIHVSWVLRHRPERTHRGRSNRLRRAWVDMVRVGGMDILAIQTLRNWVMSATMFASTCILIGLGIMGVTFAGLDLADLSQALSWAPSPPAIVRVKLLLLAALFFIGFMHFVSSLRYHNQGGFVINLPDGFFNGSAIDAIADTLNRAGDHYNQGTRVFILAAPCVLWLIGPDWFLGGVLVALLLLYRFDFHDEQGLMTRAEASPPAGFEVAAAHALPATEVIRALHGRLEGLSAFGRVPALAIIALAGAMFLIGWLLHDFALGELGMAAIGFAVAAIPEGLPAVLIIILALGVQRMAQRHAIIRRLPAVETLGSVTVICTDKTGTLTRNEMTVRHVVTRVAQYQVSGIGYAPDGLVRHAGLAVALAQTPDLQALVEVMALCNDAGIIEEDGRWKVIGEPTEGALCTLARKAGFAPGKAGRLAVIAFDSTAKFMATLQQVPRTGLRILMKGAPGPLLERCISQRAADGRDEPLDTAFWAGQVKALGAQGLRVLAAAVGVPAEGKTDLAPADLAGGLSFLGLVGIVDPPRPEAITAIAAFRQAGIRVKMITGDHPGTAIAIGREMGIGDGHRAVTGAELDAADDEALRQIVQNYDVFARTTPEHKLRLVQALQANGEVVAMTGDGVNDAPALKRADVGVAMGIKGAEATKEAAAIVLTDDHFASIAPAIEQGRTIYDNLRKSILFLLPTNGAQALVILVAVLFGFALPLAPVQVLWVNLVVAVTLSLALAFEPAESGLMQRPPRRPDAPILDHWLRWRIGLVSFLIGGATIAVFLFEQGGGRVLAAAQTMAVNTLVLGQVFFLFNCRSLYESSLRPRLWFTNPAVWIAVGVLILLQCLFIYVPAMNLWFHTTPLAARDWLLPIAIGVGIFLLVETDKGVVRWLTPSPGPAARFITRLPGKWAGEPASRFELHYLKASHPH